MRAGRGGRLGWQARDVQAGEASAARKWKQAAPLGAGAYGTERCCRSSRRLREGCSAAKRPRPDGAGSGRPQPTGRGRVPRREGARGRGRGACEAPARPGDRSGVRQRERVERGAALQPRTRKKRNCYSRRKVLWGLGRPRLPAQPAPPVAKLRNLPEQSEG
jgi:hypothetical protein